MIVFFIGWAVAMMHVGITKYVIERLKDRHRATWISLGSPGIFINAYIRNTTLLWRFMTFGGHRALEDGTLSFICRVDIPLQLIGLLLIGASGYLLALDCR